MIYFLISFTISFVITLIIRQLAIKWQIFDIPDGDRKRHDKPIPLLGGLAIFASFWLIIFWLITFTDFNYNNLQFSSLLGVFVGSLILIIVGFLDDKYKISPAWRLVATAMAAGCVIIGGTSLTAITNPFGGVIGLDYFSIGNFLILANLVVFIWLVGMTYTVKICDGLDGLSTGIVLIGALMIYLLTASGPYQQVDISIIALVLAGVCFGFLILNFYPAKIYLGESGGLFLGFILGVLAIVAGGKIATALLVMAVPILDLVRVIYLRLKVGQPIFKGDRKHLHFELVDLGFKHWQAVLLLYLISIIFGFTTLFLESKFKLLVLIFLVVGMACFGIWLAKRKQKII